jgi:hypothetical protein
MIITTPHGLRCEPFSITANEECMFMSVHMGETDLEAEGHKLAQALYDHLPGGTLLALEEHLNTLMEAWHNGG